MYVCVNTVHIYIYIYMYLCVCVVVLIWNTKRQYQYYVIVFKIGQSCCRTSSCSQVSWGWRAPGGSPRNSVATTCSSRSGRSGQVVAEDFHGKLKWRCLKIEDPNSSCFFMFYARFIIVFPSHVFFGGTHSIFTPTQMSWNGDDMGVIDDDRSGTCANK